MPGEAMAVISTLCYALSYIYLNRAQIRGKTSDNGLLPVLVISSGSLLVSFLARWARFPSPPAFTPQLWKSIILCVLAGVSWNFLGRMTLYAAIARIGATRGVVIKSAAPVVTVAIAIIFLNEPVEIGDALGFALMFGSILLLLLERNLINRQSQYRSIMTQGILLALASVFLQGIGHVLRKVGVNFITPFSGATLDMSAAALSYVLYLIWKGRLLNHVRFYFRHPSLDILAAGILSAVGSLTFFAATATAPISNVAMILGMQPIFMPFLSTLLFRGYEKFTWLSYLSAGLVSAGVLLMMGGT